MTPALWRHGHIFFLNVTIFDDSTGGLKLNNRIFILNHKMPKSK